MIKVCGNNRYLLLAAKSTNFDLNVDPIVCPPAKMNINAIKITSLSSCGQHAIAITTDGKALGIGDNLSSGFSKKSMPTVLSKFTKIDLRGIDGKKCKAVSAVCGMNYSLFLIKSKDRDNMQLFYRSNLTLTRPVHLWHFLVVILTLQLLMVKGRLFSYQN